MILQIVRSAESGEIGFNFLIKPMLPEIFVLL